MKIAHLNVARGFRGGERQTELLVTGLLAAGHTDHYVMCRHNNSLEARLTHTNVPVKAIRKPFILSAKPGKNTDLAHAHDGKSVHICHWLKRRYGIPYVVTRRVDNPIGSGSLTHAAYRNAEKVIVLSQAIEKIVLAYDPDIRTEIIPSASAGFTAGSESVIRQLRESYGGAFVVGQVGALDDGHKGQLFTVEIARRIQHLAPEIRFVLVGGGKDEQMLRDAAKDCSNIVFTGHVENVGDYLATFDMMVFPSRNEGLGSSIIDAMTMGLPVAGFSVGGIPELIDDGNTGLLIEFGDTDSLMEAVLSLYRNKEYRNRLGDAAQLASQRYTQATMVSAYERVYAELAK